MADPEAVQMTDTTHTGGHTVYLMYDKEYYDYEANYDAEEEREWKEREERFRDRNFKPRIPKIHIRKVEMRVKRFKQKFR